MLLMKFEILGLAKISDFWLNCESLVNTQLNRATSTLLLLIFYLKTIKREPVKQLSRVTLFVKQGCAVRNKDMGDEIGISHNPAF